MGNLCGGASSQAAVTMAPATKEVIDTDIEAEKLADIEKEFKLLSNRVEADIDGAQEFGSLMSAD